MLSNSANQNQEWVPVSRLRDNRARIFPWPRAWAAWIGLGWLAALGFWSARANTDFAASISPRLIIVTNALDLTQLGSARTITGCKVMLEGVVLFADKPSNKLMLQDGSGGAVLSLDLSGLPTLAPGQRIRLEARCIVGQNQVRCPTVIENDGLHALLARTDTFLLPRGYNPLTLEWFNRESGSGLKVEWAGPDFPRQAIPANALFRALNGPTNDFDQWAPGLDYRCYEGEAWEVLPNFAQLKPISSGIVSNFDLGVRTRNINVGLVFNGFLNIPREGVYTFWCGSDDGSRLIMGAPPATIQVLDRVETPVPQKLTPGQLVTDAENGKWSELEGTVTFVSSRAPNCTVEISSGSARTDLLLPAVIDTDLSFLLGCRVRVLGGCLAGTLPDRATSFSLLVPSTGLFTLLELNPSLWTDYPVVSVASLGEHPASPAPALRHLVGKVAAELTTPTCITLVDATGRICVKSAQPMPVPSPGDDIEVIGLLSTTGTNRYVDQGFWQTAQSKSGNKRTPLPLLTQAVQVKRLGPEQARRGYPVRLRGITTGWLDRGFTLQDSTWSIYCRPNNDINYRDLKSGLCCEVEGVTTMDFAPTIKATKVTILGTGIFPRPVRPTWDELVNGSLDTQYIEVQGVVTETRTNVLTLLTAEGKLNFELLNFDVSALTSTRDALIRLRGVNSPARNASLRMLPAHLRLHNVSLAVDVPAPPSLFDAPRKSVASLLGFDANANGLRRIRLAGQVIYQRHNECFLMDDRFGWRCHLREPANFRPGDLVEVSGFPVISGPSPLLQEAVARCLSNAPLPSPVVLTNQNLRQAAFDSTLVNVTADVLGSSSEQSNLVLQLQTGNEGFVARLASEPAGWPKVEAGSRVELTGVYAIQTVDRALNGAPNSFELLLGSPAAIRILSRPSWWTARHALAVIGSMMLVIMSGIVWITMLRKQVEERSKRLAEEIRSRQKSEHQRALEEERSRIARDLHDDLGATLTQIGFLSALKSCDTAVPERTREQLKQVSDKSRHMVASLDEIVWAVNPANDSVRSLAAYLRHIAEEFSRTTSVSCRLDVDKAIVAVPLTSEVRHNLCLAVREAFNNSVKHSRATELWLRIRCHQRELEICVEDNGCGFSEAELSGGRNGLANMRQRLQKIGGNFECSTRPGSGTLCRLTFPLN